jgi:hypothetical protein
MYTEKKKNPVQLKNVFKMSNKEIFFKKRNLDDIFVFPFRGCGFIAGASSEK